MTTIQQAYVDALLADAAYVDVNPGMDVEKLTDALSKRMTPTLAAYIAANFEVASSINTSDIPLIGSGFDATVWRGKAGGDFEGQVYVSMRGTEPLPGADLLADGDLAFRAAATSPIINMVNWWLRETTLIGDPARQIQLNPLYVLNALPIVNVPAFIDGASIAGTGNLVGVSSVQVNGHSMGGHMASAFARIFGAASGQAGSVNAQAISTFNSAGFNGDNSESLFQEIQALLGTGFSSFAEVIARQGNYFAANGVNLTTNDWWFAQMGKRKGLYQEETAGIGNHSLYRLTDLLAVGAALEKLDSTFTMDKLNELSEVGSSDPKASLESLLDSLRLALAGPGIERLPISDAADSDPSRMTFHAKLADLQSSNPFKSLVGKSIIESLTGKSAAALVGLAKNDDIDALAYRYALKELNPFAVLGVDYAANFNYAGHLDLYDVSTGQGELTAEYLADRAAFLTWKNLANVADTDMVPYDSKDLWIFRDKASDYAVAAQPKDGSVPAAHCALFGKDGADFLDGADQSDRIYGGLGYDTLDGKAGNDYIEGNAGDDQLTGGQGIDTLVGGTGNDTYVFTTGDGIDTIDDADGDGQIKIGGNALQGGNKYGAKQWISDDKRSIYSLTDEADGSQTLAVAIGGDRILVKHFTNNDLGIDLEGAIPPAAVLAERTIDGDLIPTEYTATLAGDTGFDATWHNVVVTKTVHSYNAAGDITGVISRDVSYNKVDDLGNLIGSLGGPNRDDNLNGSGGADLMRGHIGDDTLLGNGGADRIEAGWGQDSVNGGDGADQIVGDDGSDILLGGAGKDTLHGGIEAPLDQIYDYGETADPTGVKGDWLDGGADDDIIVGERGNDVLTGGDGSDILFGGAGDDILLSYLGGSVVSAEWSAEFTRDPDTQTVTGWHFENAVVMTVASTADETEAMYGGAGTDLMIGGLGSDYLDGGSGDDVMNGNHGGDYLDGGAGKDDLIGGGAGDQLMGGTENDRIQGDGVGSTASTLHGNDYLDGEAGNDTLWGDGGDDELFGGEGNDELVGDAGNLDAAYHGKDHLEGEDGDDKLWGMGGDDSLIGGIGNDTLQGDANDLAAERHGADTLEGGEGNDVLFGDGGADELLGEAGDDLLNGGAGNDNLAGGDNDDVLHGDAGKDTLAGGAGYDRMEGSADDDLYQFGRGDGPVVAGTADLVLDTAGNDTLRFGAGIALADITASGANQNDLLIEVETDRLLIQDGLGGTVERFEFADGTSYSAAQLIGRTRSEQVAQSTSTPGATLLGGTQNDTLTATGGGARISGGRGQDSISALGAGNTIVYEKGDGTDRVITTAGTNNGNVVRISGATAADLKLGLGSLAIQVGGDANDVIHFESFDANDVYVLHAFDHIEFDDGSTLGYEALLGRGFDIDGTDQADTLTGTSTIDRIVAGAGDDVLDGGADNDALAGGAGLDHYRLGLGIGQDAVIESAGEISEIRLDAGIEFVNLTATVAGSDAVLSIRTTGDSLRLGGYAGSAWDVVQADGTRMALADVLAQQGQTGEEAVRQIWADAKLSAMLQLNVRMTAEGWARTGVELNGAVSYASYGPAWLTTTELTSNYHVVHLDPESFTNSSSTQINSSVSMAQPWNAGMVSQKYVATYGVRQIQVGDGNTQVGIADPVVIGLGSHLEKLTVLWGERVNEQVTHASGLWLNNPIDGYTEWSTETHSWNQQGRILSSTPVASVPAGQYGVPTGNQVTVSVNGLAVTESVITEVFGTAANNVIESRGNVWGGYFGVDHIDLVDAGAGDDFLFGDDGDVLYGNDGDDHVFGVNGTQTLIGGRGSDFLDGFWGGDVYRVVNEDGVDTIDDSGDDDVDGARYAAMGIGPEDRANRAQFGGKWELWGVMHYPNYSAVEAWAVNYGYDINELLANGDLRYVEPLPALSPLHANDHRTLEAYYGTAIATDRVVFAGGVTSDNIRVSGNDDTGYLLIDMPDGTGLKVTLAKDGDLLGTGVELFEFVDGTVLTVGDMVERMNAAHTINGSAADDTIVTGAGNDALSGGTGNDSLTGGSGDDVYTFGRGDGHDVVSQGGALASDHDVVRFADNIAPGDVTVTRDANGVHLTLSGDDGSIRIVQQPGEAPLPAVEFADGNRWDESVFAAVSLYMTGTDGNDTLAGTAGRDIADGGAGNDTITGGAGDDVFLFGRGDGADTLYLPATGASDQDLIRFKPGVAPEDLVFNLDFLGLRISIANSSDSIVIPGQFGQQTMPRVEFDDGTVWGASVLSEARTLVLGTAVGETLNGTSYADLMRGLDGNDQLYGGAGNDILDGGAGNDLLASQAGDDVYLFGRGDGVDGVFVTTGSGGNDSLRFKAGVAPGDVTLVKYFGGYKLTINDSGDSIQFGVGVPLTRVEFADGAIWGASELATAPLFKSGSALADSLGGTSAADYLQGLGGDDLLFGDAGNDLLDGGTGNDSLWGDAGNDVFLFGRGDGSDIVYQGGALPGDDDVIRFKVGVRPSDVVLTRDGVTDYGGVRLTIVDTGDSIGICGQGSAGFTTYNVPRVEFADGTRWESAMLNAVPISLSGTAGADVLNGTAFNDAILGLEGSDTLLAGDGDDLLNGGAGNDYLAGGAGNDVYVFGRGDGQDTVNLSGGEGDIDVLRFAADIAPDQVQVFRDEDSGEGLVLQLVDGSEPAPGGGGDDGEGGAGGEGMGGDRLTIGGWFDGGSRALRVEFTDGTIWDAEALTAMAPVVRSEILGSEYDDELYGESGHEILSGLAGNDDIAAGGGDDILIGGAGDDSLSGGSGQDIYQFERGDGWDRIYQYDAGEDDADVIRFGAGILDSQVTIGARNGDLILQLGDSGDGMQVIDGFDGTLPSVEFSPSAGSGQAGTVWDAAMLLAARTRILGTGGADILWGGNGDDTVFGMAGDDTLYGNVGNDAYVFNRGDGWDTVVQIMANWADIDTVRFGAGIVGEEVIVARGGDDLHLLLGDSGEGLTLKDWFGDETPPVAWVEFVPSAGSGQAATVWNADTLAGLASESSLIFGSEGNDQIDGGEDADTILGRAGSDGLYGSGGADVLLGGSGDDELEGDDGDDTLTGGSGDDWLLGGEGDDTYVYNRGDGVDTIEIWVDAEDGELAGQDVIRFGPGIAPDEVDVLAVDDWGDLAVGLAVGGEENSITIFGELADLPEVHFADGTVWTRDDLEVWIAESDATQGDDLLVGTAAGDVLDGGAGYDTIFGLAGDDTLSGGGNGEVLGGDRTVDWLRGGAGNDTYVFNDGDGQIRIENQDAGNDLILLGEDIAQADVSFGFDRDEWQYVLSIRDGEGLITIEADPQTLPGIEFADGTRWQPLDLIRQVSTTAPIVDGDIADQEALEGEAFVFSILEETFIDDDTELGDVLSYTAGLADGSPLPGWLAFDAATQTFSGTPGAGDAGLLELSVTATDLAGNQTATGFTVSIASSNHAPLVATAIADASATEDRAFAWTLPADSFADSDAGDSLSYAVSLANGTALPAWLSFDPATRRLSGMPVSGSAGVLSLRVTATDSGGLSAATNFSLVVGQHLRGTASSDTLNYSASSFVGVTMIDGGAGNDAITGSAGNDLIVGGSGTDNLNGGDGDDSFLLSGTDAGYDRFEGGAGYDLVLGSAGDDTFRMYNFSGAATVEKIDGGGGNDVIAGTGSSDTLNFSGTELVGIGMIDGGAGNDAITGSAGNDLIVGGSGTDNLNGGDGDDSFLLSGADAGYDRFEGGAGYDLVLGSAGDDTFRIYNFSGAGTVEKIVGGGGVDVIAGTGSSDTLNFSGTELVGIALIDGGAGNDAITGSAGNDVIVGGTGTDNLNGGDGDDVFQLTDTDAGYDRFEGGAGYDVLQGGSGDETFRMYNFSGTATVEKIVGGGGVDIIAGTGSSDTLDFSGTELVGIVLIDGDAGNDAITGSAGNDFIIGGSGTDNLNGGAGNDIFYLTDTDAGYDRFEGGAGYDLVLGSAGNETFRMYSFSGAATVEKIDGGGGMDIIAGTGSSDTLDFSATELVGIVLIDGGAGNDAITGSAGNDFIIGGSGTDNLIGGDGDDSFLLSGTDAGYDRFEGGTGYDRVLGSAGDDTFRMYNFSSISTVEKIDGGGGNDIIAGTGSSDTLNFAGTELVGIAMIDGGAGNDAITGSAGNDIIVGGSGTDNLAGGDGNDSFLLSGTDAGYDRFEGGAGYDVLQGGSGDDTFRMYSFSSISTVEKIDGGGGNDIIAGTGSSDTLNFAGTELVGIAMIDGGAGNDAITGSAGNDIIVGGTGTDMLSGGAGDDRYRLGRGDGVDTLVENDATPGNADAAEFLAGIAREQIWLRHAGNNLEASVIGTGDKLVVSNWYLGEQYRVEQFLTHDGGLLLDSQVENLVQAMAAFAPPGAGQTSLPPAYQEALAPVIAANWQ